MWIKKHLSRKLSVSLGLIVKLALMLLIVGALLLCTISTCLISTYRRYQALLKTNSLNKCYSENVNLWQEVNKPIEAGLVFTCYKGDIPNHVGVCIGKGKVLHSRGSEKIHGKVEIHSIRAIEAIYGKITLHKFKG